MRVEQPGHQRMKQQAAETASACRSEEAEAADSEEAKGGEKSMFEQERDSFASFGGPKQQ